MQLQKSEVDIFENDGKDVNLSEVHRLVKLLEAKEGAVEEAEKILKAAKEEVENLKTRTIPDAMGGLTSVKTETGATVSIEKVVRASVLKEKRELAYSWLDRKGHGDLIKTTIEMSYPRSQLEQAKDAVARLSKMGFNPNMVQEIHWATLNAFAKEQLDKGMEFPDFIGIYEGKTTKVKYGK